MNGITMPEHILSLNDRNNAKDVAESDGESPGNKPSNSILARFRNLQKLKKQGDKEEEHTARYTLLDVFRNRRLTIYAVSMAFLW